jgi:alpha-ketoglutaric semialdehyde dehydrogenase
MSVNLLNYINGEWVASKSGDHRENINPATNTVIGSATQSTADDVSYAVSMAKLAQRKWRNVPAPKRGEMLMKIGDLLKRDKEKLATILTEEMGKVIVEARGEVQEAIDMAYYMAGEGRRLVGQTTPSELPNKHAMSMRVPVGIVGLITPWNFPIAIASWKMFPALVSGNTVVWKPASETPALANEFIKLIEEAGIPKGVVNLVHGSGDVVGNAIVEHPDVGVVSFTGSTEVGSELAAKASKKLKKVSLEMGGKNAIIVMDDANIELAIDGILWSAFGTSGQRCTACSRVIVHKDMKDKLVTRLIERTKELTLGNGLNEGVNVGPVINKQALQRIKEYVELGISEGANLILGGDIVQSEKLKGNYFQPTIFTDVDPSMKIFKEEIFGPVLSIVEVSSLDEAIETNNNTVYGLSSAIYTADVNAAYQAMRDLETGIVYINAGTIGAEIHLPFGGMKHTGNGHRDSGLAALDVCTEWKSVYVDYSGTLQRAQIDNN